MVDNLRINNEINQALYRDERQIELSIVDDVDIIDFENIIWIKYNIDININIVLVYYKKMIIQTFSKACLTLFILAIII